MTWDKNILANMLLHGQNSLNQFLNLDFFAASYIKMALGLRMYCRRLLTPLRQKEASINHKKDSVHFWLIDEKALDMFP